MTHYAIKRGGKFYYHDVETGPAWTSTIADAETFTSMTAANLAAMDPDGLNLVPTGQDWEIVPVPEVKP